MITIPNLHVIKMFAEAKGLKFYTYADVIKASMMYLEYAKFKN